MVSCVALAQQHASLLAANCKPSARQKGHLGCTNDAWHGSRVSSEALRSGALTHLEHRLQALLHVGRDKKAHHGDNKARCHPGASLDATACSQHTAGGGASNGRNGVSSVKSVEVDTGHMLTTAQGCMQATWCNPRDDEVQVETALFDMAQTAAASSSVGKRARAALQSAWDLD